MKPLKIDREWCLAAAKREEEAGDPECGAGYLARDPEPEPSFLERWTRVIKQLKLSR